MISLNDVLLAMSNIPVDDPIAEIWGRGLQGGYKIIEYTGTLPITISANGDALIDYRIYGTDGGVGVVTENLFDKNTITPNSFLRSDGTIDSTTLFSISDFIPVENGDYFINNARSGYTGPYHCVYDENKNFVRSIVASISNMSIIIGDNEKYIRISVNSSNDSLNRLNVCMVVKGTTAPTKYEPYGYKLPMTVSDGNTEQSVPVYIGENQLTEGEYVSYGEQKIYKRTENLATMGVAETKTKDGVTITCDGKGTYTLSGTAEKDGSINFDVPTFKMPDINETDFKVCFFNSQAIPVIRYGVALLMNATNRVVVSVSTLSNCNTSSILFTYTTNFVFDCVLSPSVTIGSVVPSQFVPHIVPTDPPVPLPEIPTIDGTTVIDYDGDPKPSQMYVKYKDKG